MKPFRWNIKRKEQLGRLLDGEKFELGGDIQDNFMACSAKILASSDDRKLVFIGRSSENFYDYLSGILQHTSLENELSLLNISIRNNKLAELKKRAPEKYISLQNHFISLELSPKAIIDSPKGVCFTDLVSEGSTFTEIYNFLLDWCNDESENHQILKHKLSFLGLTSERKPSPNAYRWYQNEEWPKQNPTVRVHNISIPWRFWDLLGNHQKKTNKSYSPPKWGEEKMLIPPRDESNIEALRLAYYLYNKGLSDKKEFAKLCAQLSTLKDSWLRSILLEIKKS